MKEPEDQFKFLALLWTSNYNNSDQRNLVVDAVLQAQALYIGSAMLSSQTVQTKKQLASKASPGTVQAF